MKSHVERIRAARRKHRIRQSVAHVIDTTLTTGAKLLKMCGEGPHHGWSILFAQLWFTDCPCCLFYRGVTLGIVLGGLVTGTGFVGLRLTGVL